MSEIENIEFELLIKKDRRKHIIHLLKHSPMPKGEETLLIREGMQLDKEIEELKSNLQEQLAQRRKNNKLDWER